MRPDPAPSLPPDLTPDERFRELAALLALGLRALRDRARSSPHPGATSTQEPPSESGPNCLEVSGDPRLSVHTG